MFISIHRAVCQKEYILVFFKFLKSECKKVQAQALIYFRKKSNYSRERRQVGDFYIINIDMDINT